MKFKPPSPESQPRPSVVDLRARPRKAVDVLQAIEDEPERYSFFEPKVDISPASETAMFGELNKYRRDNDWWGFGDMAMRLLILYPDRKVDLRLDRAVFEGMKNQLGRFDKDDDVYGFRQIAKSMSVLYPERKAELGLDEGKFMLLLGALVDKYDNYHDSQDLDFDYPDFSICLSIIYPNHTADVRRYFDFYEMKQELENCRRSDDMEFFADIAVSLLLLYPDRKTELGLCEEDFNAMKALFYRSRKKEEWVGFTGLATNLSILAAERAQITADGQIRLTYKQKPLVKARRPLPTVSRIQVRK